MQYRKIILLFFILYILSIIFFAIVNLKSKNINLNDVFIIQLRLDYLLHIVAFIPWVLFVHLLFRKLVLWIGAGILFSLFTEGIQFILPERSFNINDFIANLMGIIIGYIILLLLRKQLQYYRLRLKHQNN